MSPRPNGCFCNSSWFRYPGLVLIAVLGLGVTLYLAPPKQFSNRLAILENEPTGTFYPETTAWSSRWNADYWSSELPMGKLLKLKEAYFSKSLSALVRERPESKILFIHSLPSKMCDSFQSQAVECVQIPLESTSLNMAIPYKLNYSAQYFDAIVYQGIMDNSLDISRTVFEMKRVLKPHGIFLCDGTIRGVVTWLTQVASEKVLNFEPRGHRNWRLFVNYGEMERVLKAYNFGLFEAAHFTSSLDLQALWDGKEVLHAVDILPIPTQSQFYCMRAVNLGGV